MEWRRQFRGWPFFSKLWVGYQFCGDDVEVRKREDAKDFTIGKTAGRRHNQNGAHEAGDQLDLPLNLTPLNMTRSTRFRAIEQARRWAGSAVFHSDLTYARSCGGSRISQKES